MSIKVPILSLIICGLFFGLKAQEKIDCNNKFLQKEIEKSWHVDGYLLIEKETQKLQLSPTAIKGKYYSVEDSTRNINFGYAYVGRVDCCRSGGCTLSNQAQIHEENEFFDYLILFDLSGSIKAVRIFNYQATHGHEITSQNWLKQFIGFNGSHPLEPEKNVDAISGATISVYAITYDIENKTSLLKNMVVF